MNKSIKKKRETWKAEEEEEEEEHGRRSKEGRRRRTKIANCGKEERQKNRVMVSLSLCLFCFLPDESGDNKMCLQTTFWQKSPDFVTTAKEQGGGRWKWDKREEPKKKKKGVTHRHKRELNKDNASKAS